MTDDLVAQLRAELQVVLEREAATQARHDAKVSAIEAEITRLRNRDERWKRITASRSGYIRYLEETVQSHMARIRNQRHEINELVAEFRRKKEK